MKKNKTDKKRSIPVTTPFLEVLKNQKRILVFLILIVFGASMGNGYSLDDELVTTEKNSKVSKGINGVYEILTTPYSSAFDGKEKFDYRPVTQITFAVEKEIFGLNPFLGHLINVLLYIFLCLLIFRILRQLFPNLHPLFLFWVMVVFAIHPLHTEVVFSLKNREELLASVFGFLTLELMLKFLDNRKWISLLLAVLCILVGFNTKSTFAPFVYLIPLTLWYLGRLNGKQAWFVFVAIVGVSIVAVYFPRMIIQEDASRKLLMLENPMYEMTLLERLPMSFAVFATYVRMHLWPFPLVSYYGYAYVDISTWKSLGTWIGVGILGVLIYLAWRSWKERRVFMFGLLLFLGFLAPYQNFPFPVAGIIAERFCFISILGFSLLIVSTGFWLIQRYSNYKAAIRSVFLVLLVIFTIHDMRRANDWKSFLSLMEKDVSNAPESVKLNVMYAELLLSGEKKPVNEIEKKSQLKLAESAFRKAEHKLPDYPGVQSNLGVCLFMMGNYREALLHMQRGINAGDTTYQNLFNLGACYELLKDTANAVKYYQKVAMGPLPGQAKERLFALKK